MQEIQQFNEGTQFKEDDILKISQIVNDNKYSFIKRRDYEDQKSFENQYILGRGEQSIVFLGENYQTKQEVAIKVSRCDNNYGVLIQKTKSIEKILDYNFIVQVYQSFMLEKEMICIEIIELCQKSLDDEINEMKFKGQCYTFEQVVYILLSAINALCEIHANDIIHFNIKPSNILISKEGSYKLADFRFVKNIEIDNSKEINKYLSPEQQALYKNDQGNYGQKLSYSTDVYSMGLSLLQALGINNDLVINDEIMQNNYSQLDTLIEKKYYNIYSFIKYYMLQKDNDKRYSAFRLRQQFINTFSSKFDNESEMKRISKQIDLYENDNVKQNKKYLSYLYYFLSSTKDEQNDETFVQKSIQLIAEVNLADKFEGSLFYQHLSQVLLNQNKFELSFVYLKKSSQLIKSLFDENHLECALMNLQFCNYWLKSQYNSQQFLEQSQNSLKQFELKFKQIHPTIASSLDYIGCSYSMLGKNLNSLEYLEKALKMREVLFQDNHPDIALSLNNVGYCLDSLGQLKEGLKYFNKSLSMYEVIYQGNHCLIANQLSNIGYGYGNLGEGQKSLEYNLRALQMREVLYQGSNSGVADSFNNVGSSYRQLGQIQQGLQYFKKAFKMYKSIYQENHPDISISLNNIGHAYVRLGELRKGLEYFKKSLKIRQSLYQGYHPNLAKSFKNVFLIYDELKEMNKALKYKRKALQMFQSLNENNQQEMDIILYARKSQKKV